MSYKFRSGDIVIFTRAPWYFGVVVGPYLYVHGPNVIRYDRLNGGRQPRNNYRDEHLDHWPEDWDLDMLPDDLIRVSTGLRLGLDINQLITHD